jgi:hypothetical protein
VLGALTRAELERALAADAEVVAWTDGFLDWVRRLRRWSRPRQARQRHGPLGTRDGALADRLVERVASTAGSSWPAR